MDATKPSQKLVGKVQLLEAEGNTTMLVRENDRYIGIISLMDTPRAAARATLEELKRLVSGG